MSASSSRRKLPVNIVITTVSWNVLLVFLHVDLSHNSHLKAMIGLKDSEILR